MATRGRKKLTPEQAERRKLYLAAENDAERAAVAEHMEPAERQAAEQAHGNRVEYSQAEDVFTAAGFRCFKNASGGGVTILQVVNGELVESSFDTAAEFRAGGRCFAMGLLIGRSQADS